MKNFILILVIQFFLLSNSLAANFHAIIIADTNDSTIGSSVIIDKRKINTFTKNIARNTGLILREQNIYGYNFNFNTIKRSLNSLSVRRDDVVMFYYSGHSSNAGAKWPALNLKGRSLKLDNVISSLKAKKPRLLLIIADSCNNLTSRGSSLNSFMSLRGVQTAKKENYQKLFLKHKGIIVMGAARRGEYAWGNGQHGGFFTYQLLESLNTELASSSPNWNQLVKRAEVPIRLPNGIVQHPQSEVRIKNFQKTRPNLVPSGIEKCYYYYNNKGDLCCRKSSGTTCEQATIRGECPYYFYNRKGYLCCRRSTGITCE
ncbi:caspase family protein [Candidatus Marithrix sp. Canyon 246]|uniref:caspase family protein n=1 Tax=Candidatus Marithrix sp. Canyon 246 TaxID=1827136 RepID=UPI00084A0D47|nr:caspase family protein [Candidatus Marithrix sp. Canyon 246]